MITPSKILDIAYQIVTGSALMSAISGDVYKIRRGFDSSKEDVIINTLSVSNQQLQEGVLNINIHVPNLVLGNGENQDNTRPDTARIDQLCEIFKPVFDEDIYDSNTVLSLQNINIVPEENLPEYFINFRIIFYTQNVK